MSRPFKAANGKWYFYFVNPFNTRLLGPYNDKDEALHYQNKEEIMLREYTRKAYTLYKNEKTYK